MLFETLLRTIFRLSASAASCTTLGIELDA